MRERHSERSRRSAFDGRKEPRFDSSLYTAEGYLSWLAKVRKSRSTRKTRKRKH